MDATLTQDSQHLLPTCPPPHVVCLPGMDHSLCYMNYMCIWGADLLPEEQRHTKPDDCWPSGMGTMHSRDVTDPCLCMDMTLHGWGEACF